MPQPEDRSLRTQDDIASNVRQFDKNKKNPESLLNILDDVRMPLELRCLCLPGIQVLREWERLQAEDKSQWTRKMMHGRGRAQVEVGWDSVACSEYIR